MSFIRLTDKTSGEKIDVNLNHIVAFRGVGDGEGSEVVTTVGGKHSVTDSPAPFEVTSRKLRVPSPASTLSCKSNHAGVNQLNPNTLGLQVGGIRGGS